MASISSLMGSTSSSSSIYGSRNSNIISGLASGLDTESMIEGLVESYKQKITGLQQDRTKVQWQQEGYQSVSDKLVEFYRTYMSFAYNSDTNLFSSSFFSNASMVTTGGKYAELVTATGKSSSEIILNSVAQLAQAARYTTSGGSALLANSGIKDDGSRITVSSGEIADKVNVSNLEGTISLKYGDKELSIDFGELELFGAGDGGTGDIDPAKLQAAIEEKLSSQVVSVGQNTYFGDDLVKVSVGNDGTISFSDKRNAGNKVEVTNVSGKLANALAQKPGEGDSKIVLGSMREADAYTETDTYEYLSGKTITFNLDGKSKTLTIGEGLKSMQGVVDNLNEQLKDNFGAGKINLNWDGSAKTLSFNIASGSTLSVTSEAGEAMGLGDVGLTSYLNTGKTLGDLLGSGMGGLEGVRGTGTITSETVTEKDENGTEVTKTVYKDEEGRLTDQYGFLINEDGKKYYNLTINGKSVGNFTEDDALDKVMNTINNSDAGVKVQFSQITNQFVFTAKDTGEGGRIEIADNTLGAKLFGAVDPDNTDTLNNASYVAGQDAIFQVEVNGKTMNLARSTNAVEIDGMTLNFKKTFNVGTVNGVITSGNIEDTMFDANGEAVTFKAETDADTIVDAVKKMVEDYNDIMNSVKDLYTTRPATTSTGKSYEPLTDEEADGMTETEIKNYEEKAKQGILYMDSDLSSLYNSLRSVLTGNSGLLKSIGLSTEYSSGKTTLKLDETALRQAIAEDPEAVKDAFVSSKDNGAATDGLMAQMYKVVNNYAGTSGATKGILIEKAGSKYSPTAALDNTMLDKLNDIDDEIEEWQDKMSDKVDYYTNKFTQLEMLINQMNSQSSALSGLMGG